MPAMRVVRLGTVGGVHEGHHIFHDIGLIPALGHTVARACFLEQRAPRVSRAPSPEPLGLLPVDPVAGVPSGITRMASGSPLPVQGVGEGVEGEPVDPRALVATAAMQIVGNREAEGGSIVRGRQIHNDGFLNPESARRQSPHLDAALRRQPLEGPQQQSSPTQPCGSASTPFFSLTTSTTTANQLQAIMVPPARSYASTAWPLEP